MAKRATDKSTKNTAKEQGTPDDIRQVRIADIVKVAEAQVRYRDSEAQIRRYATQYKEGEKFPPILVAELAGALVLVDGFHRTAARISNGEEFIEAEIIKVASFAEVCWRAAKANLTHGLPLKSNVLHEVFRRYVRAGQHRTAGGKVKSAREIAQEIHGVKTHTTIMAWMHKDFPKVAAAAHWKKPAKVTRGKGNDTIQYRLMHTAAKSLESLLAAFNAICDEEDRGSLIHNAERTVQQMKDCGAWKPYEENPDF